MSKNRSTSFRPKKKVGRKKSEAKTHRVSSKKSASKSKEDKVKALVTIADIYYEVQEIKKLFQASTSNSSEAFGKSLRRLEDAGRRLGNQLSSGSRDLITGIGDDLKNFFGGLSQCFDKIDDALISIQNRIIDYTNELAKIALDAFSIFIEEILSAVGVEIERDPQPSLLLLRNPNGALYGGEVPDWKTISSIADLEPAKHIIIHGMGYDSLEEVYDVFIKNFSSSSEIFQTGSATESDRAYVVIWKSHILKESKDLILSTLTRAGWQISGAGLLLVLATLIREEERRAELVADFLAPFAEALVKGESPTERSYVFSHSYGSYIWAGVLHRLMSGGRIPGIYTRHSIWYSFQAAIPRDSFQQGKQFSGAGQYFYAFSENRRFHCFFTYTDIVLTTAYLWAKGAVAMGAYGPVGWGTGRKPILHDATSAALESHGETTIPGTGGYFERIDSLLNIRTILEEENDK